MRVVSGSLCLLSTPLPAPWRDSLPVGAKEGKRKRKKSMNYFLSIQSFPQSSGVCWFHEIASSPGGGLKPSNSLGACSVLGMAGTAQSQRVGLILNDKGPHSGCKKRKKSDELCCPGRSGALPLAVANPHDSEEALSIL